MAPPLKMPDIGHPVGAIIDPSITTLNVDGFVYTQHTIAGIRFMAHECQFVRCPWTVVVNDPLYINSENAVFSVHRIVFDVISGTATINFFDHVAVWSISLWDPTNFGMIAEKVTTWRKADAQEHIMNMRLFTVPFDDCGEMWKFHASNVVVCGVKECYLVKQLCVNLAAGHVSAVGKHGDALYYLRTTASYRSHAAPVAWAE